MDNLPPLKTREYGSSGPYVFVLHGGPGAPGYMAPVCVRLGRDFRVVEPFQRASGEIELTVEQHVDDLAEIVTSYTKEKVAIVGHSWGGALGLAFAVKYPHLVNRLVIIGCSTLDKQSRAVMEKIRKERTDEKIAREFDEIDELYDDEDARLGAMGAMYQLIDSYDLARPPQKKFRCDAAGHAQSWADLMRLEDEGVYPAAFAKIDSPVLMMHGDFDSHPGRMIEASLRQYIGQLEYIEFEKCGHYPWLEKAAAKEFYEQLREWLPGNL
jgi:pimeloyl-ACP methyl ester carboxylesterase